MGKIRLLLILLQIGIIAFAQETAKEDELPTPSIQMKVGIQKDKILLRWAVDEPVAWKKVAEFCS